MEIKRVMLLGIVFIKMDEIIGGLVIGLTLHQIHRIKHDLGK